MKNHLENLISFCIKEPLWASAFFICGFLIGDTYFNL